MRKFYNSPFLLVDTTVFVHKMSFCYAKNCENNAQNELNVRSKITLYGYVKSRYNN